MRVLEKVLVSVSIPSVAMNFDAFVPRDIATSDLTDLLVEAAQNYSHGYFFPTGREVVIHKDRMRVLAPDSDLSQYDVLNGDGLVLL